MKVKARFFTRLREITKKREEEIEVEEKITLSEFLEILEKKHGEEFRKYLRNRMGAPRGTLQFLINGKNVRTLKGFETILKEGDVVAIIPPVGGG